MGSTYILDPVDEAGNVVDCDGLDQLSRGELMKRTFAGQATSGQLRWAVSVLCHLTDVIHASTKHRNIHTLLETEHTQNTTEFSELCSILSNNSQHVSVGVICFLQSCFIQ